MGFSYTEKDEKGVFYSRLFIKYRKLLYKKAIECGTPVDDAWDVVQISYERLLRQYTTLRDLDDQALISYLVSTVRNTAINYWKSSPQENYIGDISEDLSLGDEQKKAIPSAEEQAMELEEMEMMLSAIEELSEPDKILMEEKFFMGYTTEEIAKLHSDTPGNVRVRLMRARKKLAVILEEKKNEYNG